MSLERRRAPAVHWSDSPPAQFYPRRRLRPSPFSTFWDESLRDMDNKFSKLRLPQMTPLVQPIESHFVEEKGGNSPGKYIMSIPLNSNVNPQDLKISLKKNEENQKVMTIEVKKEERSIDGTSSVYSEITKTVTLPPTVDMTHVKTIWTPDHFLKVEAPLPLTIKEETEGEGIKEPQEIPVKKGHHGLGHYLKKLVPKTSKT